MLDVRYKKSRRINGFKCTHPQAGVISYGASLKYGKVSWYASEIPAELKPFLVIAKNRTGFDFDQLYIKVFQQGDDLAKHQDLGEPIALNVGCFTLATDSSQLRKLAFFPWR